MKIKLYKIMSKFNYSNLSIKQKLLTVNFTNYNVKFSYFVQIINTTTPKTQCKNLPI